MGPWLPEPILTTERADTCDPEKRVETQESISLAFLVLLEQLPPFERAVFLLHKVFAHEFAEIATVLGTREAACLRSFRQAREHLREHRPRFPASRDMHRRLLSAYVQAVEQGEMTTVMSLLAEDVTLWVDGGGKVQRAATRSLHGQEAVARFVIASQRSIQATFTTEITQVNGEPVILLRVDGHPFSLVFVTIEQQHIVDIRVIANPEKLRHLE